MYSYGIQHYTVGYLLAQALVAVALIDARAVAAQFLVGAGGAVVGVVGGAVDRVIRLPRVPDPDCLDSQSEETKRGDEVPKLKIESYLRYFYRDRA